MLYLLRLDEKQKAVVKLRQLTDTFFVDWLGNNLGYLMEPNCQLTPLGKVRGRGREGGALSPCCCSYYWRTELGVCWVYLIIPLTVGHWS